MTTNIWAIAAEKLDPAPVDVFGLLGYEPCNVRWLASQDGRAEPRCGNCPQERFHNSGSDNLMYGGAAGGGKTKALLMEALVKAHRYPRLRVGMFRRTYDELAESLLAELRAIDFAEAIGARWNKNDHELTLPNGSVLRFRYAETVDDASRRQGGQYQLLCVDELTLMVPGAAAALKERLRASTDSGLPVIGFRSSCNPGGASHAEVYTDFIASTDHGAQVHTDAEGKTWEFIPAKVDDNVHIDRESYRAQLRSAIKDPSRLAAMLDGSWDIFAGQVFGEWRHERHVIRPMALPDEWRRYAGIDAGYRAPWCCIWVAKDNDGRLWVYREIYQSEVGETEQARRILEAEQGEPIPSRVIDPSAKQKHGEAEALIAVYKRGGVAVRPANNDRMAGWSRLHYALSEAPACAHHRALGWDTCPLMHVFEGCTNLIRTLPALPYSKTRVEDVDTLAEDHAPDALRYVVLRATGTGATFFEADDSSDADEVAPLHDDHGDFAVVPGTLEPLPVDTEADTWDW